MKALTAILFLLLSMTSAANPMNVDVAVEPQRQKNTLTCWMTGGAMIYGFKNQRSIAAEGLSDVLGGKWKTLFASNTALMPEDVAEFAAALGLSYEPPKNPSLAAWSGWLKRGPIWVGVVSPDGPHILVVTGLHGDGSSKGTRVQYNDPADGKRHDVSFSEFVASLERVPRVSGANPLYPQIIHF